MEVDENVITVHKKKSPLDLHGAATMTTKNL